MQTVDESTLDDVITTIDFATLFSQEELKAKRAEEKDRRKKNRFLSVENSHFLIYLICLLISIVLIAAYLFFIKIHHTFRENAETFWIIYFLLFQNLFYSEVVLMVLLYWENVLAL